MVKEKKIVKVSFSQFASQVILKWWKQSLLGMWSPLFSSHPSPLKKQIPPSTQVIKTWPDDTLLQVQDFSELVHFQTEGPADLHSVCSFLHWQRSQTVPWAGTLLTASAGFHPAFQMLLSPVSALTCFCLKYSFPNPSSWSFKDCSALNAYTEAKQTNKKHPKTK